MIRENKPYEIGRLQEKYQTLLSTGKEIINCTIGDPKDDTPPIIRESLFESVKSLKYSQYPPYIGKNELHNAIANALNTEYNINLDESMIISCNGTKEAIYSFPLLFDWADGSQILIPSLSYPIYQLSANYNGIPFKHIPLTIDHNFLPELDSISKNAFEKTQLFWINSPHNPTTAIASKSYVTKLLALAETYNFIVCSDECYNDLYYDEKPTSILEFDSEHWVCFRSLSKRSHMSGYRSGAVITKNKEIMKELKKMRSPMGIGTPSFIQDAAITAWNDTAHVAQHRHQYKKKRDQVINALESINMKVFGGNAGFYVWFLSEQHATSQSLADWLLEKGLLVTPGTVFGSNGNPYVRMVYCLRDEVIDKLCTSILK